MQQQKNKALLQAKIMGPFVLRGTLEVVAKGAPLMSSFKPPWKTLQKTWADTVAGSEIEAVFLQRVSEKHQERFSRARPCRHRVKLGLKTSFSWRKRELTGIALAQGIRSFCRWRLLGYNEVHGPNEAWAHLWAVTALDIQLEMCPFELLHTSACIILVLLKKKKEIIFGRKHKSYGESDSQFSIFQYADRCLQNLAYLHMTSGEVEKTRALLISQPFRRHSGYCWLIIRW